MMRHSQSERGAVQSAFVRLNVASIILTAIIVGIALCMDLDIHQTTAHNSLYLTQHPMVHQHSRKLVYLSNKDHLIGKYWRQLQDNRDLFDRNGTASVRLLQRRNSKMVIGHPSTKHD